jgi:hypothetical protein
LLSIVSGTENRSGAEDAAWEKVLASLCHLQSVLPEAVLVGGTAAAALYARRRFSLDHDHVVQNLPERFDTVLTALESVAGWETARVKRPGSLDGIETGVRQLRQTQPLETTSMRVAGHDVTLPTLPEVLRIKAFLCLERNATRDHRDLAALASHMGIEAAAEALRSMDELYPQKNGDTWAVRTQLVMQLAEPQPHDLDHVELAEYKGVKPPFDRWSHVAETCGRLSDTLLQDCVEALRADSSPQAGQARTKIDAWSDARAAEQAPAPPKLPGLEK